MLSYVTLQHDGVVCDPHMYSCFMLSCLSHDMNHCRASELKSKRFMCFGLLQRNTFLCGRWKNLMVMECMCLSLKQIVHPLPILAFPSFCPFPARFRLLCQSIIAHKLFDYVVLAFIFLNCITVALERPKILQGSLVRIYQPTSSNIH